MKRNPSLVLTFPELPEQRRGTTISGQHRRMHVQAHLSRQREPGSVENHGETGHQNDVRREGAYSIQDVFVSQGAQLEHGYVTLAGDGRPGARDHHRHFVAQALEKPRRGRRVVSDKTAHLDARPQQVFQDNSRESTLTSEHQYLPIRLIAAGHRLLPSAQRASPVLGVTFDQCASETRRRSGRLI